MRYCNYGIIVLIAMLLFGCKKPIMQSGSEANFSQKTSLLSEQEWIKAGKHLFEINSISPKKISCSSCHEPANYFQDGYDVAIVHNQKLIRNTPTLLNLNRYTSFFWDGRASSIRKQLEGPLFSRAEMNSDPAYIFQAIKKDGLLEQTMNRLSVSDENQAVEFVMYALEKYILSITTEKTKFHTFLDGQHSLTSQEEAGYEIFLHKAKCGRCHPPPHFTDNQFHDIGLVRRKTIFESYRDDRDVKYRLGHDFGRGNIVEGVDNLFAFRTPSLINVALTAPYMHDGIFDELEEIVDFYSRKDSILIKHPLTINDKQNLLAFLRTLNDKSYQTES